MVKKININKYFFIYSFYRFIHLKNKKSIKKILDNHFQNKIMRGTILLANEGINGTISGTQKDLEITIRIIKKLLNIRKLEVRVNKNEFLPFNKMKIKLKKEIVSFGKKNIDKRYAGNYIEPKNWDKFIKDPNTKLIDTRNMFEIEIGKFKGAINPKTKSFREFLKNFHKLKLNKNDNIAMYCTGGIRCEKASSHLKQIGYKNVSQLRGGIINYLQHKKSSKEPKHKFWKGDCFVFDNRVTINKDLVRGNYIQCHGCRHPITIKDTKLKSYRKGISCRYCFGKQTSDKLKALITRQNQVEVNLKKRNKDNFQKIYV